MGDHPLYVRYPDGTIRYGIYQSTADLALSDLVDTPDAADPPTYYANRRRWAEIPDILGEPVDIATVYGGGFAWHGTATENHITLGHDPWGNGQQITDGIPAWVSELWGDDD